MTALGQIDFNGLVRQLTNGKGSLPNLLKNKKLGPIEVNDTISGEEASHMSMHIYIHMSVHMSMHITVRMSMHMSIRR